MANFNEKLCTNMHENRDKDIKDINDRLDGHDEEIKIIKEIQYENKEANTQSHFELREAITDIKNCITILTQNQTNKTELTKVKLALYGIMLTGILSTITAILAALINQMK